MVVYDPESQEESGLAFWEVPVHILQGPFFELCGFTIRSPYFELVEWVFIPCNKKILFSPFSILGPSSLPI